MKQHFVLKGIERATAQLFSMTILRINLET